MKITNFFLAYIFALVSTCSFSIELKSNGLYDDGSRCNLLINLARYYPSAVNNLDLNNAKKVTILEQISNSTPLPIRISAFFKESDNIYIPWSLNLFPEWISTAYFQDDISITQVSEHVPRGTIEINAIQSSYNRQPAKLIDDSGVEFAENSGQYLYMAGHRDARWNYRWTLFTFRIDANSGKGDETILLDLNHGQGSNKSSPKIWYSKNTGLNVQFVGLKKYGLDTRLMTNKDRVIADGKTWNILITGIRYGKMYAALNGTPLSTLVKQPDHFSGEWIGKTTSYIGDKRKTNMNWAYDTVAFGLTEPSEAMVKKMTGWAAHRLSSLNILPSEHPYKVNPPIMDKEDFPYRYRHDKDEWSKWGEATNSKSTRVNAGGDRVQLKGFERVFYDDFRDNRIKPSNSGEADLWSSPGFNIAVGGDAKLVDPNENTSAYYYDAKNNKQTLSLVKQSRRWRGTAFYSVNDLGHGYTWAGPKVFRLRVQFPNIPPDKLPGGLFPAFWSYGIDFMFWRTANRVEVDWFEFDGLNGYWLSSLSSHFHYPALDSPFAQNPESYQRYKGYGGELTEEKSGVKGGLYIWDGHFHTWEFVVDHDFTYINVTIKDDSGSDKWVELGRVKTPPIYLERLDIQLDYALKLQNGEPKNNKESFVIDWIEVLQKSEQLAQVPEPFHALPLLEGEMKVGSIVNCQSNLAGITDIRYYWFIDGYPVTYSSSNKYQIRQNDNGKGIRCMVKAVGALNQPEAWSLIAQISG
jgi:hypothetical protein